MKLGNVHLESSSIRSAFYQIGAVHPSYFGFEMRTGNILVSFSGFNNGLQSYNAFTLHFAGSTIGIEHIPMTAKKLDGLLTLIVVDLQIIDD